MAFKTAIGSSLLFMFGFAIFQAKR